MIVVVNCVLLVRFVYKKDGRSQSCICRCRVAKDSGFIVMSYSTRSGVGGDLAFSEIREVADGRRLHFLKVTVWYKETIIIISNFPIINCITLAY